ncbi:uncharacterized protein STEHIDRAFT_155341 [Stereum hirsutum FP-91666 SS1]|uniref:uncharacterized protein n=1 Tax=Stereum hirsutum (strain FP-91666) TaxID=721885 RepID=UPI000440D858|nr:uncharacterized protein STEHIDRAFT_155341 [Stereum hirsutum FP-91666 SS1]EIM87983.1 hypothetical protein STEHIDRAFT_155341 [Stereum hirsutum FP-91666 SS1]
MFSTVRPPRLPFEILAKIFTLTSPIASNRPFSSNTPGGCHPLALAHVSQQWRAVALSTPRLWNEIHVVDGIPLPETFPAALTFWLSLSTLYLDLVTSKSGIHVIHRCVHLLSAHAHHWKEASFVFMNTDLDNTGLTSLFGVFPRLDKLRISCGLAAFVAGPRISMDVATLFPQLKDVHITHCSINRWDIPWTSLTTARLCHDATYDYPGLFGADYVRDSTIYKFDYYLLLSGLVQAVNLHTLHLDLVLPVDTFDYLGIEPVSMPNLRSLSLSASQAYKLSLFFTYVGCPILEELSLSIQDQDPSEWDDTIHSKWTEFL